MPASKEDLVGVALVKRACPVCAELFDAEIIMNTRLTKSNAAKVKEMHHKTVGFLEEPCEECKKLTGMGIVLVGVKDGETDGKNPYRTGDFWVVKEEAVRDILKGVDLSRRVVFIEDSAAKFMGLKDCK